MVGPFHRLESDTQSAQTALLQLASSEIWGKTARGGFTPSVKAYAGDIPAMRRGIVFSTAIDPNPNGSPLEFRWYLGTTAGVLERRGEDDEQFACITANITNRQPVLNL